MSVVLRVLWCATPLRCTVQRMAFSSMLSVGCWVGPFRQVSPSRSWERTTHLKMRRTLRSALWGVSGFLWPGILLKLEFVNWIVTNQGLVIKISVHPTILGIRLKWIECPPATGFSLRAVTSRSSRPPQSQSPEGTKRWEIGRKICPTS